MLNQGKKSGLQFRSMLRGSGQRNIESAPVGAIQNVLLSQHGFIRRSPPRKQPGGRREPQRALRLTHFPGEAGFCTLCRDSQRTARVVRLSENSGRGKDAGAGGNMPPMPRHGRAMPHHNAQASSDRAAGTAVRAARGHQPACLTTRRSKHAIRAPGLRCTCLPCSTYGSSTPARAKRLAPFSSARLAPSPDGPLTHFASPRGETCSLAPNNIFR